MVSECTSQLNNFSFYQALEGSISGSDFSLEDDDLDPTSNTVSKLMTQVTFSDNSSGQKSILAPRSPVTWFHSPPSTQLGIYGSVFSINNEQGSYSSELKSLQMPQSGGRIWIILMVAGGHFAGVVVQVAFPHSDAQAQPPQKIGKESSKSTQRPSPPPFKVLKHKTFHRYTSMLIACSCSCSFH
jgi:Bacteroidetes VLRF1 release factor